MRSLTAVLRAAGSRALHAPVLRRAAFAAAASRGRALILVYHRVTPGGPTAGDVVPTVSAVRFRAQLEALAAVGDIVPLTALDERPAARGRVRFAITFDDDEPTHARHALPVLRELGVPATFFLQGRALHDLPPPWWILLEHAVARHGLGAVTASLGVAADTAPALAAACEGTPLAEQVVHRFAVPGPAGAQDPRHAAPRLLAAVEIRALAEAGMGIGFHTVEHPVLTRLASDAVRRALHDGRDALAAAAGVSVDRFAYPHGRVDRDVASLAREAGYHAAYRTGGRSVAPVLAAEATRHADHDAGDDARLDAWMLGRWEPGPLAPDALLAHAAFRLTVPAGAPRRSSTPANAGRTDEAPPRARRRPT